MKNFSRTRTWNVQSMVEYPRRESLVSNAVPTLSGNSTLPSYANDPSLVLETALEKKLRRRSHWVAYTTMMVMTIGFSVVLTGIWPYLQSFNPDLTKESLGWVVAANPLGQMLASPILGYIGNRLGSIRIVCYFTMSFFIGGNLFYSFLPNIGPLWENSNLHLMILSRFIIGVSSSNVTLCRSYLAASTTNKERTKGIAIISAAQSLGFILGPTIQTILSLTIVDEVLQYRAAGWVAACLGVVNFILLTPCIFKEYSISRKEQDFLKSLKDQDESYVLPRVDYRALFGILFGFFVNQFVYVLIETLMEPFLTDQYAWCNELAVVVVGILFTCAGFVAIGMSILAIRLSRTIDERKILLTALSIIALGIFLFIPWGPNKLVYCSSNETVSMQYYSRTPNIVRHSTNDRDPSFASLFPIELSELSLETKKIDVSNWCDDNLCYGCPVEQEWCDGYNQLAMPQFFVGFFTLIIGYPLGVAMSNSIFSKMLGPKPQGFWMGILTSSGSFSRVLGPVFVSYVYANEGTAFTFSIILALIFIAILELLYFSKRIIPLTAYKKNDSRF